MENKFYITTPVYYVNSHPHIGHSYTNIICDSISRHMKKKGKYVFFLTGTDEHGQKIQQVAEKESKTSQEFVDSIVPEFKNLWDKLNIKYSKFIRTTEEQHIKTVQYVLNKMFKKGDLYLDEYKGWYCIPCETFWSETQAVDRICPDCQRDLEQITETNYFFKISKYQKWLKDYINENKDFIKPQSRYNEVLGYLSQPLDDLCITRPKNRLQWGIDVPFSDSHVTYVWFDALINYISGCGYPYEKEKFNALWPADLHVIGKDILKPHTVYWPIMLKSIDLDPPKCIFAHGWWMVSNETTKEAEKMSKSKGNIIDPNYIAEEFGVDGYRYFLMREIPLGIDGNFSKSALIKRLNSDLANDLGNLVHRTFSMVEKYIDCKVPSKVYPMDDFFAEKIEKLSIKMNNYIEDFNFQSMLIQIWDLINTANKYIEYLKPWKLYKNENISELDKMLFNLMEVLRVIAIVISPVMPETAQKIYNQLSIEKDVEQEQFKNLTHWGSIASKKVKKAKPLFPRIDTD